MRYAAVLSMWLVATPALAQRIPDPPGQSEPSVAPRVYFLATVERFAAADTFNAAFGGSAYPFFGGGIQAAWKNGFFLDGAVSYFRKTGERAFAFQGETFGLGIPVKATLIPVEFSAGYRFGGSGSRVTPFAGGGLGIYNYKEESGFDEAGDEVSSHKAGYFGLAGVEFRMSRRIWSAVDVQYSRVPGILGDGGLSALFGEDDLGGFAIRFRLMVGN
jgi:opacity protein-like surface antigen